MKTLHAEVPDLLLQELHELAKHQGGTVDHLVSLALTAQVSAWRTRESIASRAARVDWRSVDENPRPRSRRRPFARRRTSR